MAKKTTPEITVPLDQLGRQATDALRGYVYQIYQTALAWLALRANESLHVEFAEDFAISADGKLSMTQVKDSSATLTLRSKSVAALITSTWQFQKANPDRVIVSTLSTTGAFAAERGIKWPSTKAGLHYWRVAAKERADVRQLREVLATLKVPADLLAFVKKSTDEQLRAQILKPIKFLEAQPGKGELEAEIRESLITYGRQFGVGPTDSANAIDAIVGAIIAAVLQPTKERLLTSNDLAKAFERYTHRTVPLSMLRGLDLASGGIGGVGTPVLPVASVARSVVTVPISGRAAKRRSLVQDLDDNLAKNGAIWLHGSSGLGKTTLALLVAQGRGSGWLFADLRDKALPQLRLDLQNIADAILRERVQGLMLDDLPADLDNSCAQAFARVVRTAESTDTALIITSMKPPPPTLAGRINRAVSVVAKVPYLTETDVAEVVENAGGDASKWARVIHLFSGGGHPQLVDARVVGLSQRGWPNSELLADITPSSGPPGDMEQEKVSVQTRLLKELSGDANELLLRLSLFISNFDRASALVAAGVPIAVARPGLQFDALLGPWIEQVGRDRFRVSPLLRDGGQKGLAEDVRLSVQRGILAYHRALNPFPADQLAQMLVLGLAVKDHAAVEFFARAVVSIYTRDKAVFKRLADVVSIAAIIDVPGTAAPGDRGQFAMLLLAQFLVAVAIRNSKRARLLADRALEEAEKLPTIVAPALKSMIAGTAMIERELVMAPREWFPLISVVVSSTEAMAGLVDFPLPTDPSSGLTIPVTTEEMMFVTRATALRSIAELEELIEILDAQDSAARRRYLLAVGRVLGSLNFLVSAGWLADVKTDGFDANAAAARFKKLRAVVEPWGVSELDTELACAEAIMLDEYAGDADAALRVLADAEVKHPRDYRLIKQRQKLYYRAGKHAEALAEFNAFEDRIKSASPVERVFTLREVARSSFEVGDIAKAREYFDLAWQAASQCSDTMAPMKAGLSGDCAVVAFLDGDTSTARALVQRGLIEADGFEASAGPKELFYHLMLGNVILWMRSRSAQDWPGPPQEMVVGSCSMPDPPNMEGRVVPPHLLFWYQLAELEAETSDSTEVLGELRQRTNAKPNDALLPMESTLLIKLVGAAIRFRDEARFFGLLPFVPSALAAMRLFSTVTVETYPRGVLAETPSSEWAGFEHKDNVQSVLVLYVASLVVSEHAPAIDRFIERLRGTDGANAVAEPVIDWMERPRRDSGDLNVSLAGILGEARQPGFRFDGKEAFLATVWFWQFASTSVFGDAIADEAATYLSTVWRQVVAQGSFSLSSPAVSGPQILEAVAGGERGALKIARLVIASEKAVKMRLGPELRAQFENWLQKHDPAPQAANEGESD